MRFYDTAGIEHLQTATANGTTNQQLPRHYLAIADGYILVYDTERSDSLDVLVSLKKDIDKNKDKKEVCFEKCFTCVYLQRLFLGYYNCDREQI